MIVSGFVRMDSVTVPDLFMSVIRVSESGTGIDPAGIREELERNRDSLDCIAVASDTDPLEYPDLFRVIKEVRPKGMDVMIVTGGRDPAVLDDLIGAGYAQSADIIISGSLNRDQERCMDILRDNRCRFHITLHTSGQSRDSAENIAAKCRGCSSFILKCDKNDKMTASRVSELMTAGKKAVWNVKMI